MGDLVFALYGDVAPMHVAQLIRLTELGVFDNSQVMRIIPNFVLQFSDQYRRLVPLTAEQDAAITNINAEFSTILTHQKGILTMARYDDDINSATTSFSIMLGPAPHLDNAYTIFGHLESGGSVVDRILGVALNGETPAQQIRVNRAFVVTDSNEYYLNNPLDPTENMGMVEITQLASNESIDRSSNASITELTDLISLLLVAIVLVSLLGVLLNKHLSHSRLVSLLLVNVLIAGFGIFIIITPATEGSSWLGLIVFMGLFGLFRLMSRFEKSS